MIRKPNDDSLVYAILIALNKGASVLLVNEYSVSITYKNGTLSMISPYRILLNRMFKLCEEKSSKLEGIEVFEQTYLLDYALKEDSNDLPKLIKYYENTYLFY